MSKLVIDEEIQRLTEEAIAAGVRYDWGSKDSSTGGVDCSGWVREMMSASMRAANEATGETVFTSETIANFTGRNYQGSGQIYDCMVDMGATGYTDKEAILANAESGLVLFIDARERDDFGNTIDHTAVVYAEIDQETGKTIYKVSESASQKGVSGDLTLEAYLDKYDGRNLFAANFLDLAEEDYRSKEAIEKALALSQPRTAVEVDATANRSSDNMPGEGENNAGKSAAPVDQALPNDETRSNEPAGLFDALLMGVAATIAAIMAARSNGDIPLTAQEEIDARMAQIEAGDAITAPENPPGTLPTSSAHDDGVNMQLPNVPRPENPRSIG